MKLAKNMVYNFLNLTLMILAPLVTIPYVSRIFSPDLMGGIAYTSSSTRWFSIFAGFALIIYAGKTLSATEPKHQAQVYSQIFWLNFLSTFGFGVLYLFYVLWDGSYPTLFLIQSLVLIGNLFETSWFYTGTHNFRAGLIRNIFTKATAIALTLLLVKEPKDLPLYLAIQLGSNFISGYILFYHAPPLIAPSLELLKQAFSHHLKPALSFFVPFLIAQVYTVFDKILLLKLGNAWELGIYDAATKVVVLMMVFSTSITGVLLPKISQLASQKDQNSIQSHIKLSLLLCNATGFCLMALLYSLNQPLVQLIFGNDYKEAAPILKFLAPLMLLLAWNSISSLQILYPHNRQNAITLSVACGASISMLINIIGIPKLGAHASALAWTCSEILLTTLQIYFASRIIPMGAMAKQTLPYLAISVFYFMWTYVYPVHGLIQNLTQLIIVCSGFMALSAYYFIQNKHELKQTLHS